MVLTSVSTGTITTDGTEQTIVSDSSENFFWHMIKIYTDSMLSGDKITLKIYDYDTTGAAYKLFDTVPLQDAQTNPTYFSPPLPCHRFKITIQRTAGTDRAYNWERLSAT